jgi:hypothetical protein
MNNDGHKLERNFWRYWLGGLLLLALMIVMNTWLSNDISQWGIRDHQSAGTAQRVNAIQNAWQAAGVLGLARLSIAIDLVYIAIYSYGVYCGGRLFANAANSGLQSLGRSVVIAAIVLGLADYTETLCQFVQAMQFRGNDNLARIAVTAQPVKSIAFLTTFIGIMAGLIMRRMARRRA